MARNDTPRPKGLPSRRAALERGFGLAAAAALARPAEAAVLRPLHIATNLSESAANAYFAKDQGFFQSQGIDATIETFGTSGAYANGIVSGTFDIGAVACGSLVSGHAHGIPFMLLANGGIYNAASPTTLLVVTKDSPLRTAVDFNGKTIAVSTLRDIVQVAVMEWIDKNGGDYKSVNYVEMSPGLVPAALTAGRIDGAFLGEPFVTEAGDALKVIAAPSTAVANNYLVTGWTCSTAWLAANPALAKSFQAAMAQASTWAMANRDKANEVLAINGKIPPAIVAKSHHVNWEPKLSVSLVQPVIDAMAKYGILTKPFPATEIFG